MLQQLVEVAEVENSVMIISYNGDQKFLNQDFSNYISTLVTPLVV